MKTLVAYFVCGLWIGTVRLLAVAASSEETSISYVMEPFESVGENWFKRINNNKLSLATTCGLFGTNALRVQYRLQAEAPPGSSFADFGHILGGSRRHNCYGATHLSLWYKVIQPQSMKEHVHLRLVLMDESNCKDCSDLQHLEHYYSFHSVLDSNRTDWQELRVELRGDSSGDSNPTSQVWGAGWLGQVGYDKLDTHLLKGWRIELAMSPHVEPNSRSEGVLLVDQLACVGGGDMFGAVFHSANTFEESVTSRSWDNVYFQSLVSRNMSSVTLDSCSVNVNYTIQQTEPWGGFIDFEHLAPDEAYYNLSQASAVSLGYQVLKSASPKGRVNLRIILMDESHCLMECDSYTGQNLEKYYSFHNILDEENLGTMGGKSATVLLFGDKEVTSPFSLTGWAGIIGNGVLDKSRIKGFSIELNMNSQGDIGSLVSGTVVVGNMTALTEPGQAEYIKPNATTPTCVAEPGVFVETRIGSWTRVEFQSRKCCEMCDTDPDCLYAIASSLDCYLASQLDPDSVSLQNSERKQSTFTTFWKNDVLVRGDFCSLCECSEADRTIDCRGRDLKITPRTFSPVASGMPNTSWTPRVLDLTGNPNLTLLGLGALDEICDTLEELRLPSNMRHISLKSIKDFLPLRIVHFEGINVTTAFEGTDDVDSNGATFGRSSHPYGSQQQKHRINNIITEPSDFFEDVCCTRGEHVGLQQPTGGLTFCDMKVDTPGADAAYEYYYSYSAESLGGVVTVLNPNSTFMAEAAESPAKCAEYCANQFQCMYFSYDDRKNEAEPSCILLSQHNVTRTKVCCAPDDYADVEGTRPGWTSGWAPRTRRLVDNAKLVSSSAHLVLDKANNFKTHYVLSLGATPLRGAVWVEPTVAGTTNLIVAFSPSRIVLYDNITRVTITVTVLNAEVLKGGSEEVLITNTVKACDAAFRESNAMASENTIQVDVVPPKSLNSLLLTILVPVALVLTTVALAFIYIDRKRRQGDAAWTLTISELHFNDPPTEVGRGSFGLVVLAEYRGTKVVVKPLIASREETNGEASEQTTSHDQRPQNDGSSSGHSRNPDLSSPSSHTPVELVKGPSPSEPPDSSETLDDNGNDAPKDVERGPASPQPVQDNFAGNAQYLDETSLTAGNSSRVKWRGKKRRFRSWTEYGGEHVCLKPDLAEEMRHLSKLRHPCIATVMGAILERKKVPMLVVEYMDHGSLRDLLNNETMAVDGEHILPILRDVAQGLRFLHTETPQIIHGNLKAQNILVDSRFRAKVADFGLCKRKRAGATGSLFWMAPELIVDDASNTAASDVYSFGITLYEVYSRKDPYDGEDVQEVMKLVSDPLVKKRPPVPASCPLEIQNLMNDCQRHKPEQRPSFEELDMRFKRLDVATIEPWEPHLSMQTRKAKRTDKLLRDVFPYHVAQALRDGLKVEPESHEMVTIFFSDIVGFTKIAATISPMKVSDMLDRLYNKFDALSRRHAVFKVETIGDAYMGVTNLLKKQHDHAKRIVDFSIDAVRVANETLVDCDDPERGFLSIRVGFHSGPVVANVVGSRNPRYCLFGDSVNTASRMESNSRKNCIHCSESAAQLLRLQHPGMAIYTRGWIKVKGKGMMKTYWCNDAPTASAMQHSEHNEEPNTHRHRRRRRSTGSVNTSNSSELSVEPQTCGGIDKLGSGEEILTVYD